MSRKPKETSIDTHSNSIFTFNLLKLRKELKHTDLFISGGGTLIQDVTSTRSLIFYLFTLSLAKRCGAKVEMYGCGIGPINKEINKKRTASILNSFVDAITLRDSVSEGLLREIGVNKPEIMLAADPTVNLPEVHSYIIDQAYEKADINTENRKIIFCLRPWEHFENYIPVVEAAEYAYNKYALSSVFLPMEYPTDVEIGKKIGGQIKTPHYVSTVHHTIEELRGMLANAELVVGMRLHSLIFAASGGSPIVGLSYDVKVDSFIKDSGAKRLVHLDDLSSEELIKNIDLALADGRAMGEETKLRLQNLERKNKDVAEILLGEKI